MQFLPGFQDDGHNARLLKQWSFTYYCGRITIFNEANKQVRWSKPNEQHVRHHLVVNRRVRDVAGVARESHFGIATYECTSETWTMITSPLPVVPMDQLRVQFLDVRSGEIGNASEDSDPLIPPPSPPATESEFWSRITGQILPTKLTTPSRADDFRASPVKLSVSIRPRGKS